MMTIYVADFKWGESRIVSVEVVRDTGKQYQVDPATLMPIRRSIHVSRRLNKGDFNIFPTLQEAQIWCTEKAQAHIDGLEKQLEKGRKELRELRAEVQP